MKKDDVPTILYTPLNLPFHVVGIVAHFCVSGYRVQHRFGVWVRFQVFCCSLGLGFKISRFCSLVGSEICLSFLIGLVGWVSHFVWADTMHGMDVPSSNESNGRDVYLGQGVLNHPHFQTLGLSIPILEVRGAESM